MARMEESPMPRNDPPRSALVRFLSGTGGTLWILSAGILLLFLASIDAARYGTEIAASSYFGSLIALWQYPVEWPLGNVLSALWIPLPGAPLVALAALANLILAGWSRIRRRGGPLVSRIGLAGVHFGLIGTLGGYALLLAGSPAALIVTEVAASVTVAGLALFFFPNLATFFRRNTAGGKVGTSERLSRSWLFAPVLGASAGAFLAISNGAAQMAHLYGERHLDLLPILLYGPSLCLFAANKLKGEGVPEWREKLPFSLLSGGIVLHSALLAVLCVLRGLPPVTDLHSSALFAGWIGAVLAVAVEKKRGDGLAGMAACIVGGLSLAAGFFIGADFSQPLAPVIASRSWLVLHVCTIAAGYGAAGLAVILADAAILARLFTKKDDLAQRLAGFLSGTVASALVLTAAGVLLGGFWAERAWGRFWGWDPKENAALMLVLWLALLLHARRGGHVALTGFVSLAALSGLFLAWSWAGVNLMGAGLHSYGFASTGAWATLTFALIQGALVAGTGIINR
jgi:ABC-type transport system involved in cytochrome c biogenesis permease subunit